VVFIITDIISTAYFVYYTVIRKINSYLTFFKEVTSSLRNFAICEHKSKKISCGVGQVLYIRSAVYGRNNRNTCPHSSIRTIKCASKNSLQKVRQRCDNKRSCTLEAKNSVFGDPCRGTFKYLNVRYQCKSAGEFVWYDNQVPQTFQIYLFKSF